MKINNKSSLTEYTYLAHSAHMPSDQLRPVNLSLRTVVFEKARDYLKKKPRPRDSVSSLVDKLLARELRKNGVAVPDMQ